MLMIGIAPSLAVKQIDAARINPAIVAARDKQSALLTLKAFGRYAITAMSALDVALQSPDRMAGAVPIAGESGKQDVRLDLFLDRGEYKTRTYAPSKLKWLQSKESGSDLFLGATKQCDPGFSWYLHYQRTHITFASAYVPSPVANLSS